MLTREPEPQKNGKTINWCTVDVGAANGTGEPQGIVCGAHNFEPGDLVVVILPGGVLPGNFEISARKTYGHLSAGMICSARELGLGEDHDGIIVLPADAGEPGEDARDVLGLREEVIEFEINPDRAYALSLRGVAREAALGFDAPYTDPADREVPAPNGDGYPVVVDDPAGCPVFVARIVSGFDPTAPTPDWMVQRLAQCGQRSISLAVDVTNYVMLELGRPIHGYDADKLSGPIRVRRATEGERLTTLDGVDRALSTEDLVVTDDSGIIGLGGVMGGETTEMSGTTTRVLVEAAHWDAVSMFRTGKRHRLTSEAGKRNERGVDPVITPAAADRVVELLVEHGGGTAEPGVTVVGEAAAARGDRHRRRPARADHRHGDRRRRTVRHLAAVGCTVEGSDDLSVVPPTWRPDLTDPYDLVEEVARIVGYDQVPSVLPREATGRGLTRSQRLRRRIGRTLAGAGCVEVISFPFVGEAAFDKLGLPADDPRRHTVRLANPLSSEEPSYTTTLLPGLLEAAARNLGRGAPGVALFETGTVAFPVDRGPTPIYGVDWRPTAGRAGQDARHAARPAAAPRGRPGRRARARRLVGRRPRGRLGRRDRARPPPGRRALGRARGPLGGARALAPGPLRGARTSATQLLGHAGELHPQVCRAFGVPAADGGGRGRPRRPDGARARRRRRPGVLDLPGRQGGRRPGRRRAATTSAEVEAALREGAGDLLESVRLFDVYTGAQVGEGRKSLAFALRFRAPDRTLTEAETGAARDAAVALAAERCGAVQR